MKILIIGGTEGIGKVLSDKFDATAISRRTGHAVPENIDTIVELSLGYDVIINCIPDENQNLILDKLWNQHKDLNLETYFITLGSMSWRLNFDDHCKNRLQKFSEEVIFDDSKLRHTLLNPAWCFNTKAPSPIPVIIEDQIIDIFTFLLDQTKYNSVIPFIEIKGK